ncbi:hypothetical protein [Jidongwangia harbinensis]|nr:hypothetical protein [Jidongwangia harbinensis]MCA2214408.1 hypothetical protein [Jidongwangia harbinensis]
MHGALIISTAPAGRAAPDPRYEEPALVVTWVPDDNGGVLRRALVRLAG